MIRDRVERPPAFLEPIDEWRMIESRFHDDYVAEAETITSVGNGYLGLRGNHDEVAPRHTTGTFVNGFHETWPIVYGENAYGFARTGQTMLNVPDGKTLQLYVDDAAFRLDLADVESYRRVLDMAAGVLDRHVEWRTPSGALVAIDSRRMVSFTERHLALVEFRVTVVEGEAELRVVSSLVDVEGPASAHADPRKAHVFAEPPLLTDHRRVDGARVMLGQRTRSGAMTLGSGADHVVAGDAAVGVDAREVDDGAEVVITMAAVAGQTLSVSKFLAYHDAAGGSASDRLAEVDATLDRAVAGGVAAAVADQRRYLDAFWARADVEVEVDPGSGGGPPGELQQTVRWNLFQVLCAAARADGRGVAAKGLTGQAYEGHSFWDTEIYVVPFLTYTCPEVAANLLRFRHGMLDHARARAAEMRQAGAMFPWRTITGEEASAYYAAGTAQYHINADIAYALGQYVRATGDVDLFDDIGVEILIETARMWADLGFYSDRRGGRFCIHGVTGPDEYTAVVDDNLFTNVMARRNLADAADAVDDLRRRRRDRYEGLVAATGLDDGEVAAWRRAAGEMFVPFDGALGVHAQDADFLDHPVWDFDATPPEHYPLLLHYHPLTIYRHQVLKQADVVLAMFLAGDEFTLADKRRAFDYYDPLTTGDSSLSACIQSIGAAEIGDTDKAMDYARYAVLMDLADVGANVSDGCHIASMGGTWMVMVNGFAGLRDHGGRFTFRPRLPRALRRLRFRLAIGTTRLRVTVEPREVTYVVEEGSALMIWHGDEPLDLELGAAVVRPLADPV